MREVAGVRGEGRDPVLKPGGAGELVPGTGAEI